MDIKPIEFDEPFDGAYIPVNSRYEVQTKGKGSSFRIANTMTHERWIVTDERLHPMLTELAYGTHAELVQAQAEITRLNLLIADMQKIDNVLNKKLRWFEITFKSGKVIHWKFKHEVFN